MEDCFRLVSPAMQNNFITIDLDLEDDISVNVNKNEIIQALINILTNGKDVLKERVLDDEDRIIFIGTKKLDDSSLELKIVDSAGGVDDSIIEKIFDPYFTTKHKSIGTGLGLSMVDKIIRETQLCAKCKK